MIKADDSQIWQGDLDEDEGITVPIFITSDEVEQLLAQYQPGNQFSPPAGESREIARVLLDALKAFVEK